MLKVAGGSGQQVLNRSGEIRTLVEICSWHGSSWVPKAFALTQLNPAGVASVSAEGRVQAGSLANTLSNIPECRIVYNQINRYIHEYMKINESCVSVERIHRHTNTHAHTHTHIYIYIYICIYIYIYMETYTHTHIHTYIRIHSYAYILQQCVQVHTYTRALTNLQGAATPKQARVSVHLCVHMTRYFKSVNANSSMQLGVSAQTKRRYGMWSERWHECRSFVFITCQAVPTLASSKKRRAIAYTRTL